MYLYTGCLLSSKDSSQTSQKILRTENSFVVE
jgi:hypothetical protein